MIDIGRKNATFEEMCSAGTENEEQRVGNAIDILFLSQIAEQAQKPHRKPLFNADVGVTVWHNPSLDGKLLVL